MNVLGPNPDSSLDSNPMVFVGGRVVPFEGSINVEQLKRNLHLSVTERWEQNRQALELLTAMRRRL